MKTFLAVLFLAIGSVFGTDLNLNKDLWFLNADGLYNSESKSAECAQTLGFTFTAYHGYYGIWNSYLVTKLDSVAFAQSQSVTMHVRISTLSGNPVFRWDSEPENTCWQTPAQIRPYFTSGPIYGEDLTRWWARTASVVVTSPCDATISVSFDPANWSSVYGGLASQHLAEFNYSLGHVQLIGATMGGGCFFSHGITTEGGDAMLELMNYGVE